MAIQWRFIIGFPFIHGPEKFGTTAAIGIITEAFVRYQVPSI